MKKSLLIFLLILIPFCSFAQSMAETKIDGYDVSYIKTRTGALYQVSKSVTPGSVNCGDAGNGEFKFKLQNKQGKYKGKTYSKWSIYVQLYLYNWRCTIKEGARVYIKMSDGTIIHSKASNLGGAGDPQVGAFYNFSCDLTLPELNKLLKVNVVKIRFEVNPSVADVSMDQEAGDNFKSLLNEYKKIMNRTSELPLNDRMSDGL